MQALLALLRGYPAFMQDSWDDWRVVLAIYRAGRFPSAAKSLGINETTVARRLRALEARLGHALFVRGASGQLVPTESGRNVLNHAETMETAHVAISRESGSSALGPVRISSVPVIVNRVLVPNLALAPGISAELVPEARNLSLTRREADLALRLARPTEGGWKTMAQKLGTLSFGVYGAANSKENRWIKYEDASAHLPQARWLDRQTPESPLRVCDLETALEAAAHGIGQTLLPDIVAGNDNRLVRLADSNVSRPVWLLSHADDASRPVVAAAKAWLGSLPWESG